MIKATGNPDRFGGRLGQGNIEDQVQRFEQASAWPTPAARDFKGVDRTDIDRGNARPLNEVATTWSTPRASDAEKGGPNQSFGAGGTPLPAMAAQWSTPSVADVTGGRTSRSGDRKGELLLNSMAAYVSQNSWPTPTGLSRPRSGETLAKCGDYRKAKAGQNTVPLYLEEVALASSLPAPATETDGPSLPETDQTSSRPSLNPAFVEWLMGWPPGWTSFGCSETAFSHFKADMRSALSRLTSHAAPPAQLSLFG